MQQAGRQPRSGGKSTSRGASGRARRRIRRGQLSFAEGRIDRGWGGPRTGAGRKSVHARPPVHHVRRPPLAARFPCHVRLRVQRGIPSLRTKRFMKDFRASLRRGTPRKDFRLVHYSVQRNHVHLLVEARDKDALGRGMKALATRLALSVKRVFRKEGRVLWGRYWLRILRTPREVRSALRYVLLNARKHYAEARGAAPPVRLDVCSSGRWFDGWRQPPPGLWPAHPAQREVAEARTWLLSAGWRRHRLIDPAEVPGDA